MVACRRRWSRKRQPPQRGRGRTVGMHCTLRARCRPCLRPLHLLLTVLVLVPRTRAAAPPAARSRPGAPASDQQLLQELNRAPGSGASATAAMLGALEQEWGLDGLQGGRAACGPAVRCGQPRAACADRSARTAATGFAHSLAEDAAAAQQSRVRSGAHASSSGSSSGGTTSTQLVYASAMPPGMRLAGTAGGPVARGLGDSAGSGAVELDALYARRWGSVRCVVRPCALCYGA